MCSDTSKIQGHDDAEVVIRVTDLSKMYEIYDRPPDRLKQWVYPTIKRLIGKTARRYFHEFWALKHASFELRKGQTVGIIGRNGSGKSTLLQLICGTLTPTAGSVETHGRVAALLELGSGFNPEFTGRENVYMNAAILGMSASEVDAKFDDIINFADIGEFIEQPVKSYSSGMMLRLAFAVIAHVDADILVVDEALAVGDAIFTQKCMRFIRAFQEHGTLLFVSHDMAAVQNMCESSIWLSNGEIRAIGPSKAVADAYLQYTLQSVYGEEAKLEKIGTGEIADTASGAKVDGAPSSPNIDYEARFSICDNLTEATGWRSGSADVVAVSLTNIETGESGVFAGGESVRMTVEAEAHEDLEQPILGFIVKDRLGQDIFGENTLGFTAFSPRRVAAGQIFKAEFDFRLPMLPNGKYVVMASVADGNLQEHVQHHYLHDACVISVSSSKVRWGLVGLNFDSVNLEIVDGT